MTGLGLLVGVLWVLGGLQSEVLAQDGEKVVNLRALERLESLVASLNESLHETREDLQEVRLCLNETKTTLGEVQREKESLEAALLETRRELASRLGAMDTKGSEVDKQLKRVKKRVSRIEKKHLPRQLSTLAGDVAELTRDMRRLEDHNLPRRVNDSLARLMTAEQNITVIQQEIEKSSRLAATQWQNMSRLASQVTQQDWIVDQLSDSVTEQKKKLDNLTGTVAQLIEDVDNLNIKKREYQDAI